jgi:hypothetical protein
MPNLVWAFFMSVALNTRIFDFSINIALKAGELQLYLTALIAQNWQLSYHTHFIVSV